MMMTATVKPVAMGPVSDPADVLKLVQMLIMVSINVPMNSASNAGITSITKLKDIL